MDTYCRRLCFVDRGDPRSSDFVLADFTIDNTWHELDLSGIVPANAKGVLFRLILSCNEANKLFRYRKGGNILTGTATAPRTQVAGILQEFDEVCSLDSARKIEYLVQTANWTRIDLTVKGWWF